MKAVNFQSAKFLISAPSLKQCPPERGAEVAFAGRSNAGKSSAINKLTNNSKLVRTSKTPGATQLINFFTLQNSDELRLVDLPGYGYAKVSQEVKNRWQLHLSQYLHGRQSLRGVVILMDIRQPLQDLDITMIDWAVQSQMQVHALLTKSDKLSGGAAKSTLFKIQNEFKKAGLDDLVTVQTFSAHSGDGVDQLARQVSTWLLSDNE
ncbi:YihA family ribosome biogenesis GTP-binding protein [bacterium]|nr:YihA family ribosome biogenesis GTP-binding protein [bacterium]QQR56562.1 MAG: YihA family ribosome biogenesis GTP-binding protein [Candidatus Melainabacteria bacterium]